MKNIALFLLYLMVSSVQASYQLSGFGTVGVAIGDQEVAYDNAIDSEPNYLYDTRFGLNFTTRPADHLTFFSQLVYKYYGDARAILDIEWLFGNYFFSENFEISFGLIRHPFWLMADQYDVGFLYPWVRPHKIVYGVAFFENYQGASLNFNKKFGQSKISSQLLGGNVEFKRPDLKWDSKLLGIKLAYDYRDFHFQASYALLPHMRGVISSINHEAQHDHISIGMRYYWNSYQLLAEYAHFDSKSKVSSTQYPRMLGTQGEAYYATIGKEFDLFSLFLTYSRSNVTFSRVLTSPSTSTAGSNYRYRAINLTLSHAFSDKADIKLEWEHNFFGEGDYGLYGQEMDSDSNLYTMTCSFIF